MITLTIIMIVVAVWMAYYKIKKDCDKIDFNDMDLGL